MAQVRGRQIVGTTRDAAMLERAADRLAEGKTPVDLDVDSVWLEYSDEVDLLYIKFVEEPSPSHSDDDQDAGVVYHYDGAELVSVEILDITGRFTKHAA